MAERSTQKPVALVNQRRNWNFETGTCLRPVIARNKETIGKRNSFRVGKWLADVTWPPCRNRESYYPLTGQNNWRRAAGGNERKRR